jgi:hypothetical protein
MTTLRRHRLVPAGWAIVLAGGTAVSLAAAGAPLATLDHDESTGPEARLSASPWPTVSEPGRYC